MQLITQSAQVEEVCREIDRGGRFAMDLEFIPERTYVPEMCLVQVATDDEVFLIDPIALKQLMPLWERIADPNILKVLHAADQDLDLVYNASGLTPQNIMDTQLAGGFIGLGYPLGYGKLLQQLLGLNLSKTESFTDWTHRPLSKSQIEYAIDDVRHILPVYDKIVERLNKMERLAWVQEECKKYTLESHYTKDRSQDFMRVKGANTLSRRGLAILRELCDWRHSEATESNRPLKSIIQDGVLLEFARRPANEVDDFSRTRGIRPDQVRQYGRSLLKAVKAGQAIPESELPRWPTVRIPSRREVLMADVLYTVLRVICFDLDIAAELVATRGILEALVRQYFEGTLQESKLPIMQGWRYRMAGEQLVGLLGGAQLKMQFRDDEHPVAMELGAEKLP